METKIYFRDMEGYEALTEHQKKYIGKNAAFDLEKLPARAMQEEMDGFIQERMRKVAITTLQTDKTNYNLLCRFLAEKERGLEHFLDWKRDKWFRKVKAWMREYLSVKIQLLEISGTAPGFSGTGRFQSRTGKGYMEAGKAGYPGPGKSGKKI